MAKKSLPAGIDPNGNGLRIRIYKYGKVFHSETIPGNPNSKTLIAQATARQKELKALVQMGLPIAGEESDSRLFEDVAQEYLELLEVNRGTASDYLNILNSTWLPHFTGWPLEAITQVEVKKVLAKLTIARKTKITRLTPLRGVFDHAEISPNPANGIKLRKEQKEPIERYRPVERDALLAAMTGQARVYFAVLFGTGLRPGEALGLTWADYDGVTLDVTKQITEREAVPYTKTKSRRKVYVPEWVRHALNGHDTRFKKGHIFLNTFGTPHLDSDRFCEAWVVAHKVTGLEWRRTYICRHTRAAELLSSGNADYARFAAQLGHSLEMFLRTYSELIEEYKPDVDDGLFEGLAPVRFDKTV